MTQMGSQKPESRIQNEERRQQCRTGLPLARIPSSYWLLTSGFCLLFLTPGCAPSMAERTADRAVAEYYMGDYRNAQQRLAPLAQKADENYVLNNVRLGSAALVDYNLDQA